MSDTLDRWRADAEAVIIEHVFQEEGASCSTCVDTNTGLSEFPLSVPYPCVPVTQAHRVLALCQVVEAENAMSRYRKVFHDRECIWATQTSGDQCDCGLNVLRDALFGAHDALEDE